MRLHGVWKSLLTPPKRQAQQDDRNALLVHMAHRLR